MPDRVFTPDDGTRYAKALADLYGEATARLLQLVAARLARGITDPGWAEQKATELLALRRAALKLVQGTGQDVEATILEALTAAYADAAGAGVTGTNTRAIAALARDIADTLTSTDTGVLRAVQDVYRRTIADVVGQSVTGAATRREAAAAALDRFAAQGIGGFVDRAGRRWNLASYAEMAARTGTARAHLQGAVDRVTADGSDLVIVSDAPEECRLCRPFEGRVLSTSGREPTEDELRGGHRYAGTLADARAAGLFHPNCRHSLARFVPGLTRRYTNTRDPHGDQLRQRQRLLERRVRESKQRVAALEPLGNTTALAKARGTLKARQDALRGFIIEHDRKDLAYRTSARR